MNVTVALSEHFGHCLLGSNRPEEFIRHNTISDVLNDKTTVSFTILEETHNTKFSFILNNDNITMEDQNNRKICQFKNENPEESIEKAIRQFLKTSYVKFKLDYYTYNEDKTSPGVIVFPKFR